MSADRWQKPLRSRDARMGLDPVNLSLLTTMPPSGGGGTRSSLDRLRDALEDAGCSTQTTRTTHVQAQCPVHEDGTPSLSIDWKHGVQGGHVLLLCHGCGARANEVAPALGLSMPELFDDYEQRPTARPRPRVVSSRVPLPRTAQSKPAALGRVVETYPYTDEAGVVLYEVHRFDPKDFRPRRPDSQGGWLNGLGDVRRVIYRLPEIKAAVGRGDVVAIFEGEADVHAAVKLGIEATTNASGARNFPGQAAAEVFTIARDVRVVLDQDAAGYARGVQLHRLLTAVGATVHLLLPVPTHKGADFRDHLAAGHSVDELVPVSVDALAVLAARTER